MTAKRTSAEKLNGHLFSYDISFRQNKLFYKQCGPKVWGHPVNSSIFFHCFNYGLQFLTKGIYATNEHMLNYGGNWPKTNNVFYFKNSHLFLSAICSAFIAKVRQVLIKTTIIKELPPSFATPETRQDCYDTATKHFLLELVKMDEPRFPLSDHEGTKGANTPKTKNIEQK